MFRVTQYMRELVSAHQGLDTSSRVGRLVASGRGLPGPVVIWNLIRRCNLTCKHCYAQSADHDYVGELNTQEVFNVMDDLQGFRVPVLILSGGEPLLRPDIFDIAARAKTMGFYTSLSTNGTLIDAAMAQRIDEINFDYVGISLDGLRTTHDKFRRLDGAFDKSLAAVRHLEARGIKVGLRYTMTALNAHDFPALLELMRDEGVQKFYFSHLNYAGRGNTHRDKDAHHLATREAMNVLFDRAWASAAEGRDEEFVTGNNDADGPYLLHWLKNRHPDLYSQHGETLRTRLVAWGEIRAASTWPISITLVMFIQIPCGGITIWVTFARDLFHKFGRISVIR